MGESIGLKVGDAKFWHPDDLRREVDRIFDICHSCRLCFKFCGSFPHLFELVDGKTERLRQEHLAAHPEIVAAAQQRRREAAEAEPPAEEPEGEVGVTFGDELPELTAHTSDLTSREIDEVVDLCFQCKLCYPNCPYTPPHDFAIDFPRLLLRWKAQRVRRTGIPLRTRLMRDTALVGRVGSLLPAVTNWALQNPLNRRIMEGAAGIHRSKLMPAYHGQTFPKWWALHRPALEQAQSPREGIEAAMPMKVALFSTCLIDYNCPGTGKAAVQVLEHNGVEVIRPDGQVCCGMPFLDEGDIASAEKKIRRNVEVFADIVRQGYAIVIPSPSCSLMVREDFAQIVDTDEARLVAEQSYDLNDYLYRIAREGRLKRDFKRRFGSVRYHVPCHIRVQNIGIRGRDLLRLVADVVEPVQECSGHDGTWSMRTEHFEESLHWGRKAFDGMRGDDREQCALACTDCRLAALHIRQGADRATVHPVAALAHAYGFDVDAEVPLQSRPVEGDEG
jgi:Fe-S oxidoreductase